MFNGVSLAIFSGGSLLVVLISAMLGEADILGLILTIGLGITAWNEFRGRNMLRKFEPRGCQLLGWNQVGLMAMIIAYAAWMLGKAMFGPNPYAEEMVREPGMERMLGYIDQLYHVISFALYGGLIAGTLIFQGLNAVYYFSRRKLMKDYLRETPAWIVQIQQRSDVE